MRWQRTFSAQFAFMLMIGGCQCQAPQSHVTALPNQQSAVTTSPDRNSSTPEKRKDCTFTIGVNKNGEWIVRAVGPADLEGENTQVVLKNRPGPAGGAERKVDPKYSWNLSVKETGPNNLVLVIEFDSLGSPTGIRVTGDGVIIDRVTEEGRPVRLPVELPAGKHELEIVANRP